MFGLGSDQFDFNLEIVVWKLFYSHLFTEELQTFFAKICVCKSKLFSVMWDLQLKYVWI